MVAAGLRFAGVRTGHATRACLQGSDSASTGRAARAIIQLAAKYGGLDSVIEYTMLLCKRRAQLTKVSP